MNTLITQAFKQKKTLKGANLKGLLHTADGSVGDSPLVMKLLN